MAADDKKEDIPAFKISEKKIDDSWKEEVRREREAAAARAAAQQQKAAPAASASAGSTPPSGKVTFDEAASAAAPAQSAQTDQASSEAASAAAATNAAGKPASPIEQQQTKIFLNFLEGLAQQALMQLGEMENPYSGQQEVDIQGARYTLELLATIQNKTKGNLNDSESKALNGLLQDLRATYAALAQEMQRQMAAQLVQGVPKK